MPSNENYVTQAPKCANICKMAHKSFESQVSIQNAQLRVTIIYASNALESIFQPL